jgi:Bacterial protein of unknown function (Gcw_chp)
MKKKRILIAAIVGLGLLQFISVFSQEGSESGFSVGSDFYSSYIWRGTKYGSGPAVQPSMKYSKDWLTIGAWGSFDFSEYQEVDIFFSVALPAGFNLGITDYYFPGFEYSDYSEASGSHAFELNGGFTAGNFNLTANYIFNKAGGAGSSGGDKYFQAGYSFKFFNIFLGAGDGWHTYDSETGESNFALCNLGIGTSRTIKVTDSFNIPVTGQLIFNPDKNQMFLVVGFTL